MSAARSAPTDAATCELIARTHARTFSAASRFLPREKRRAAYAIYAFCRVADDLVDEGGHGARGVERALEGHRAGFVRALRGDPPNALFRELSWAVRRYGIPPAPFHELVNMLRQDIATPPMATWDDLAAYCEGVASTVGVMCAHVFGLPTAHGAKAAALRYARGLGVAMQLTNILRDVGEDACRGRCYLPREELERFGIATDDVLLRRIAPDDERWVAFMQFQVTRARALYHDAAPGLRLLDRDAQCCATACSRGYAAILGAIERRRYDSLSGRARIGRTRKAVIAFQAWRESRSEAITMLPASGVPAAGRSMPSSAGL